MIELRTLGGLWALAEGTRVHLGPKKQQALLVYLVFHQGRAFMRDQLASLLWESTTRERARHCLSQALYDLRRRLPSLQFVASPDTVLLMGGSSASDLQHFDRAFSDSNYHTCVELYKGPFLDGFVLDDAQDFDEWAAGVRARVEVHASIAAQQRLAAAERVGNWADVVHSAELRLALDPSDAAAAFARVRAIAAAGDLLRARAEYNRARQQFASALDDPLLAEATTLSQSLPAAAADKHLVPPEAAAELPLVGREAEFAGITTAWGRTVGGTGRAVVVRGEAGIGKTRLCDAFTRYAAISGAKVLRARCYPSEAQIPFRSFVDALRNGVSLEEIEALPISRASVVAELLPELQKQESSVPPLPALDPKASQLRLFDALARLVRTLSTSAPVILFLDDFHWADDSTSALVHYLGREISSSRVFILLSVRLEDQVNGSAATRVLAAGFADHFERVDLAELTPEDVRQLVQAFEQTYSCKVAPGGADWVWQRCRGNPFLIVETLRALANGAGSTAADGASGLQPRLTRSIEEFLKPRFYGLDDTTARVIAALAVIGRESSLSFIGNVLEAREAQVLAGINQLQGRRVLVTGSHKVRFAHDLLRQFAYNSLTEINRRSLHLRVAERLLENSDSPVGLIAYHFNLGRDQVRAKAYALQAAEQAQRVYAHKEAEHFLQIAIANAGEPRDKARLQKDLGDLLLQFRSYSAADQVFTDLERFWSATGGPELVDVLIRRAIIHAETRSVPLDALLGHLATLNAAVSDDDIRLAEVLRWQLVVGHIHGDLNLVTSKAAELFSLARRCPGTPHGTTALTSSAALMAMYSDSGRAIRYSRRALAWAKEIGDPARLLRSLHAHVLTCYCDARLSEAERLISEGLKILAHLGPIDIKASLLNSAALILIERGEYLEAEQLLRKIRELEREVDLVPELSLSYANLAEIAWYREDHDGVQSFARQALTYARESGWWYSCVGANALLGLVALDRGKVVEAKKFRIEMLEIMQKYPFRVGDFSYAEVFLARLSVLEGNREPALKRIEEAIADYEKRDAFCRWRLQLERARLLMSDRPQEAASAAQEVRSHAARVGARPLVDQADSILDRIEMHAARERTRERPRA